MKIDLYNEDCKVVLEDLVDRGIVVDTIIADIPYNIKQADWDSGFNLEDLLPLFP